METKKWKFEENKLSACIIIILVLALVGQASIDNFGSLEEKYAWTRKGFIGLCTVGIIIEVRHLIARWYVKRQRKLERSEKT